MRNPPVPGRTVTRTIPVDPDDEPGSTAPGTNRVSPWNGPAPDLSVQMVQACLDGIAACDDTRRCISWNPAMERLFGLSADEVVGESMARVLGFLGETSLRHLQEAFEGKPSIHRACSFQVPLSHRQGICDLHFSALRANDGQIVGAMVLARDVGTGQPALELIRETEARFRTMANCAPVLLWMSDTRGDCTFFNESWLAFTGRPMEQELGVGWAEGIHPLDFQRAIDHYMEYFAMRLPFEMEYRLRRRDGEYRWVLDRGVPRSTPGGDFLGYIGSCVDITDHKHALEQLTTSTEQLVRANQGLERFAYVASHDLQEPIRSIIHFSQLLQMDAGQHLGEQALDALDFVIVEGKRLKQLIDGLLEYSRAGAPERTRTPVDLRPILEHMVKLMDEQLTGSGASVTWGELPEVIADGPQLSQLLQNLLANALKFRSELPPEIRIECHSSDRDWIFCVQDNGIGFEGRYSDQIFEVFRRLHRSRYPGSGIGLAICKKIVENHGGRIWAESVPGTGSRFFFTLPRRPAERP